MNTLTFQTRSQNEKYSFASKKNVGKNGFKCDDTLLPVYFPVMCRIGQNLCFQTLRLAIE